MEAKFEEARIKKLLKNFIMYKNKIRITKLIKSLGFPDSSSLEDFLFDLDLIDLQIDIDEDTVEYSPETIKKLEEKVLDIVSQDQNKQPETFELNEHQKKAVEHKNGPALVIAGAGSGKTMTLSYRVANLVSHGVSPSNILLLTFTRKSAKEMLDRASRIAQIDLNEVEGGTFHSFANSQLRRYAKKIGLHNNFTIIDQPSAQDTLQLLATNLGFITKENRFPKKSSLLDIISKSRNKVIPLGHVIEDEYPQHKEDEDRIKTLYSAYQEYKKTNNLVDYDDLLVHLKFLLQTDEYVRKQLSSRYTYIMVDEYQDTNKIQADLVYWLAKEHENIMVVGDDAQSIYAFRGANFKNILNFREYFPDYSEIKLEISYRCSQPILNLANAILKPAKEVTPRILQTYKPSSRDRVKPCYWRFNDISSEANRIATEILRLRSAYSFNFNNMAVLVRSSFHAREIERVCTKKRIPYIFYGGRKWSELAHVQDVMAYLRVLYNPSDKVAWQRILLLLSGIGGKTALNIINILEKHGYTIETLQSGIFATKKYFSDISKLAGMLLEVKNEKVKLGKRIEIVTKYYEQFLEQLKNPKSRVPDLIYLKTKSREFKSLGDFINDLSLTPPNEKKEVKGKYKKEDEDPLVISTIHSAKGLEWKAVFIARVIDGEIPSDKSVLFPDQLEEERRLLYVAVTRAKDYLYLTAPQDVFYARSYYGQDKANYVDESRFITEIENVEDILDKNLNYY